MDDSIERSTYDVDHTTHHTGTDLDVDGYYCTENVYLTEDFTGDDADYTMLSSESPSMSSIHLC